MASSSSAFNHHVFLSFRGDDVRKSFVAQLEKKLTENGIRTFKDDKCLALGSYISPALIQAIEAAKYAIVVLSPNYATSRWCLEELVHITERADNVKLTILPVFYGVSPSDVRKQAGSFAAAFEAHEKKFIDDPAKVQKWREALTSVGERSGEHSANWEDDLKGIEKIVAFISEGVFPISVRDSDGNVGMEAHLDRMIE